MVCDNTGLEGSVRLLLWRVFETALSQCARNHMASRFYGWILEAPSVISPRRNMPGSGLFWAVLYGWRRDGDPSSFRGWARGLQWVRADERRRSSYQTRGLIHGRSRIRASDPKRTNMIGNFRMAYEDRPINCNNYPWIARHLNKPHHEIENDPLVWEQIASIIDSELFKGNPVVEASLPSTSLVVKQNRR